MKVPLIIDGAVESNLRQRGLMPNECMAEWILKNKDITEALYESYAENGSEILCTPTASANSRKLEKFSLENRTVTINHELCCLTARHCSNNIRTAGVISSTGHIPEPFGDADFFQLFNIFFEQADILKKSGADILWVQAMTSLAEMRAAIIACKRTGLPIYASVKLESDMRTNSDAQPLSCLICVQALGVEAFGFEYCDAEVISSAINEIIMYSSIPIIARPDAGLEDIRGHYNIPASIFAENALKCIESGASIIGGGNGTSPEHMSLLRHIIEDRKIKVPSPEKYNNSSQIIATNASQPFFLNADSIEASKPLLCSQDMADEIIEINESNLDIIRVEIQNYDDAVLFCRNSNLVSLPVMFTSSNRFALETALMLYNGKALIDRNCDIDKTVLYQIEKKYGAVIY